MIRNRSMTIDRHFIWLLGVLKHESHPDDEACCQSCNLIVYLSDSTGAIFFPHPL